MDKSSKPQPILVFTYGNPSRGDDALGPEMYDRLQSLQKQTGELNNVELLTDYQLQVEHAVDFEHRDIILFIDASVSVSAPFAFVRLYPEQDDSYSTHAMSHAAVLSVYTQINNREPADAYLLTIRGYEFDLGEGLSEQAVINLNHAFKFVSRLLKTKIKDWNTKFTR